MLSPSHLLKKISINHSNGTLNPELHFIENKLILGTRQGHLLMYSFEPNPETNKLDLQLLQYDKNFSKKPITQIETIPEYKLIFSLSDGVVNVNDYSRHNFPLIHMAQKTKGATVFALDIKVKKG